MNLTFARYRIFEMDARMVSECAHFETHARRVQKFASLCIFEMNVRVFETHARTTR